jgi:hypothetical protein
VRRPRPEPKPKSARPSPRPGGGNPSSGTGPTRPAGTKAGTDATGCSREDPALYDEKTLKWAAGKRKEPKSRQWHRVVRQAETVVERWFVSRPGGGHPRRSWRHCSTSSSSRRARTLTRRGRPPCGRGAGDPRVPALTTKVAERRPAGGAGGRTHARADRAFTKRCRDEVASAHVVRQIDGWEAKRPKLYASRLTPTWANRSFPLKRGGPCGPPRA